MHARVPLRKVLSLAFFFSRSTDLRVHCNSVRVMVTERAHGYNRNSARARCHTIAVACEQSILHLHAVSVLRGVQAKKNELNF